MGKEIRKIRNEGKKEKDQNKKGNTINPNPNYIIVNFLKIY